MVTHAGLRRRLPALAVVVLGLAGLYVASSLAFGTVSAPGSGFFPTLVCILIVIFGGIALADGRPAGPEESDKGGQARVWVVVVGLAVYIWALKPVGFPIATAVLLVMLLRGIGNVRGAVSAPAAIVGAAACYWGFTRLGVPLPAGVLGF